MVILLKVGLQCQLLLHITITTIAVTGTMKHYYIFLLLIISSIISSSSSSSSSSSNIKKINIIVIYHSNNNNISSSSVEITLLILHLIHTGTLIVVLQGVRV